MRLPDVPRTLRKVVVAAVVGSLTYFVTDLSDQPQVWSVTMTVLIGSITFVVQFLVDVEARLTSLPEAMRQEIAKIGEATELYSYLDSSAVQPRSVTSQPPPVYPS